MRKASSSPSTSGRFTISVGRAARNMIRAGVSQEVAKSVTGHVTDSMFSRYNITSTEDQRKALQQASRRKLAARVVSPTRSNQQRRSQIIEAAAFVSPRAPSPWWPRALQSRTRAASA